MKKKHLLMIFAMFTAVVLTFLVGGLLTYDEPGFTDSAASWDKGKIPLSLCIEQGRRDLVLTVQASVNTQLGFDALVLRPEGPCDITIRMGVAVEVGKDEAGGNYKLERRGDTYTHCDVTTANTGLTEIEILVLEHEMGHCLGLAHDDFDASIMRRVQKQRRDDSFGARFTDWDRELLREKYLH